MMLDIIIYNNIFSIPSLSRYALPLFGKWEHVTHWDQTLQFIDCIMTLDTSPSLEIMANFNKKIAMCDWENLVLLLLWIKETNNESRTEGNIPEINRGSMALNFCFPLWK